jgi:hypothetical protein
MAKSLSNIIRTGSPNTPLPVSFGGTGLTATGNTGNILVSDGTNWNSTSTLSNYLSIKSLLETATISSSAPTANTNFDVITQAVQYYTSNTTTNFTFNIRGNSSIPLNSVMQVGQSATIALLLTNSTTAYYPNAVQIDSAPQTIKWQGGTAVSAGNVSAIDIYSYTIIKTANNVYTLLGSQTKFA